MNNLLTTSEDSSPENSCTCTGPWLARSVTCLNYPLRFVWIATSEDAVESLFRSADRTSFRLALGTGRGRDLEGHLIGEMTAGAGAPRCITSLRSVLVAGQ
jgi:hypothetical protein